MAIVARRRAKTLTIKAAGADGVAIRQRLRALSWADVKKIVLRFDQLNPYATVEHILKVEDENHEAGRQRELLFFAVLGGSSSPPSPGRRPRRPPVCSLPKDSTRGSRLTCRSDPSIS
jgi:hypothetical protein